AGTIGRPCSQAVAKGRSPLSCAQAELHRRRAALMGPDVGGLAGIAVAEVWNGFTRIRAGTCRRQLKTAGLRRGIEAGVRIVNWFALDAMRFVARWDAAVAEVVVEIVVDVPSVVARTVALR